MNYMEYKDLCFKETCEIRKTQEMMLKNHLQLVMRDSRFYQKHFKDIEMNNISFDNLKELPTTTKIDIENNNSDFVICEDNDIAEIVRSSGTSGKPTKIVYTEKDLKRLEYNELQALTSCGICKSDTVLLTCTMDRCFIAGLAYFLGARAIGAATIRNGASSLESHLELIRELKPNVIIGVPSFLLKLAKGGTISAFPRKAQESVPSSLGIQKLICIGEPLRLMKDGKLVSTPLCNKIEKAWGAKAYSTYASSEMVTAFCECTKQQGGHLIPELAIVEILDEYGNALPSGKTGEVTITPFHFEAMPLVRYRTGDMAELIEDACECGRNSIRLSGISGRKNQMIKCKGTTFYPTAINTVLDGMDYVREYQVTVETNDLSDEVSVSIALKESADITKIKKALHTALRVKIDIITVDYEPLMQKIFPLGSRKPVRLVLK